MFAAGVGAAILPSGVIMPVRAFAAPSGLSAILAANEGAMWVHYENLRFITIVPSEHPLLYETRMRRRA